MTHGNKKYFFEQLVKSGDTLTIKPPVGRIRVNTVSLKQQMKSYQKENCVFEYDIEEHRNGSVTLLRK